MVNTNQCHLLICDKIQPDYKCLIYIKNQWGEADKKWYYASTLFCRNILCWNLFQVFLISYPKQIILIIYKIIYLSKT